MRTIKFRAWDKKEKKMVPVEVLVVDIVSDTLRTVDNQGQFTDTEILQCTNLKDKNGKEIYEGDIVTTNLKPALLILAQFKGEVRLKYGCFCLYQESELYEPLFEILDKNLEIIGNIYENKELLK